ncbi:hypothetical protein CDL12_07995 [Handroanthus impetiginosus]|uniref:Sphingolipid delta4-desaturase N-terminal domain-containing protein n=1 Tax=Handroanthus impetiginosus TaxID=429701 RepID=A0A2G9HP88_9LAMI|nr:hypothetical protein CDL12_07995 [Handroanthus impetiginosus]
MGFEGKERGEEDGVMATDFFWSYTDEPHATRRRQILSQYPEIKQLFGPDPFAFLKVDLFVSMVPHLPQLYLIPSLVEANLVRNTVSKSIWVVFQLFFYALRPLFLKPKPPGIWEFINLAIQLALDAAIVHFWGWKSFGYLILSTFVGGGMHPMAGHFISEHYVFNPDQETYSYYGPLNLMTWSVGYHNEHHDFPRIPGSKLHKVKEIAPKYYEKLGSYQSWSQVIYMYIMDRTVGPFSRMKRNLSTKSMKKAE